MITPDQLRSAARFGTSIGPDNLYWLAEELERLQQCGTPKKHTWEEPVLVASDNKFHTFMISCDRCGYNYFQTERVMEVG